ncbi:hypothetical protein [Fulvimarina sp. MAC8]|uniref:hypothetical protein n=1 Tax=Fulvimarina sp. MAC8 TaxID=3162874 RepID=UPI0032EEE1EC
MRFFLRMIGTLFLAIATVFAVGDVAQYVADDVIRMATIAEIARMTGIGAGLFADGASPTAAAIGTWPFAITFAIIGAVLTLLGRKPRRIGRA